jgi:hypothetical protein
MESIKSKLNVILSDITDFAVRARLDLIANPGLSVAALGSVGLPISPRDVDALIRCAQQSPLGARSETRLDTNAQRTWDIGSDRVELGSPEWDSAIQQMLAHVRRTLGRKGELEARLDRLSIYEKGGMLDKHSNTKKAHGIVGTLVVALVSPFYCLQILGANTVSLVSTLVVTFALSTQAGS